MDAKWWFRTYGASCSSTEKKKKIDEKYVLFYATAIWTAPKIITFKIHAAHMQMVNKVWLGRQMKMILGKSMLQR